MYLCELITKHEHATVRTRRAQDCFLLAISLLTYFTYFTIRFLKQRIIRLSDYVYADLMIAHKHVGLVGPYLCLIITIDRACSTLLDTVNTFCACVHFAANVGKLSYLFIVLMGHTMVVNIHYISSASLSYQNG